MTASKFKVGDSVNVTNCGIITPCRVTTVHDRIYGYVYDLVILNTNGGTFTFTNVNEQDLGLTSPPTISQNTVVYPPMTLPVGGVPIYSISIPKMANILKEAYVPFDFAKTQCRHQWKSYVGLQESFNYCTVCDRKKTGYEP